MSTKMNKWLNINQSTSGPCRVCKKHICRIEEGNDDETVATLNGTLIRALGSSTPKGGLFCRYCTLTLMELKRQYDGFDFARDNIESSVAKLRAKLTEADLIPGIPMGDSTTQDDLNSQNNQMAILPVSSVSSDVVSELENYNADPKQQESVQVDTQIRTSGPPDIGKNVEKIFGWPLVDRPVSVPEETDAATSSKSPDNIVQPIQQVSKAMENKISFSAQSQKNNNVVSSPSSTKVTSQIVDKIVKATDSVGSDDANEETKDKRDAPLPQKGQSDYSRLSPQAPRKSVSFGKAEILLGIGKDGRKRMKLSQIDFTYKQSHLRFQLLSDICSEIPTTRVTRARSEKNIMLPNQESENKPTKITTYLQQRKGRSKDEGAVRHDDQIANREVCQEMNKTPKISTENVEEDLKTTQQSEKIDGGQTVNTSAASIEATSAVSVPVASRKSVRKRLASSLLKNYVINF